jgi:CBS domain containing-hemolysin-like protein
MSVDQLRLRALAQRLDAEAELARALARRVDAVSSVAWQSAAAAAFLDRVAEAAIRLRHTATRLDGAADLTRAHALAVERAIAALAELAHSASTTAQEVGTAVPRAVAAGADDAARWAAQHADDIVMTTWRARD